MAKFNYYHLQRENNPKRKEAFTADFLGKVSPVGGNRLRTGCECLEKILKESLKIQPAGDDVLIIGLTESGIIPSILMQRVAKDNEIETTLLSSTRRSSSSGIVFIEKHSHGPNHTIPVPNPRVSEIWIVEDELTTGNTVLGLLSSFCSQLRLETIRIFSLADFRDKEQKNRALELAQSFNVKCIYQSFISLDDNYIATVPSTATTTTTPGTRKVHSGSSLKKNGYGDIWLMPEYRSSVYEQPNIRYNKGSWQLPGKDGDTTVLVIGETVDIATRLALENPGFSFQHITLSPWKIDNRSIVSKLDFDGKYFLYNYQSLCKNVRILNDPIDNEISEVVQNTLVESGFAVSNFSLPPHSSDT